MPGFAIIMVQLNDSTFVLENHTAECSMNYSDDSRFKTIVYVMYCTIFAAALLGNGCVCLVILTIPRMRTVTNLFIMNLAIGDVLMSVFCIPFSFVSQLILSYWPFGVIMCHMVNYSQAVSVLVSAYTLVAIAVDRYLAITNPLRPRLKRSQAQQIIAAIWISAMAIASPIPVVSKLFYPDEWHELCDRSICHEGWPTPGGAYIYSLILLVVQFVLPLAVLIYAYTTITFVLWGARPPGEAESDRDRRIIKKKWKLVKMMMTAVIAFTLCWLPFNALVVLWNESWENLWYLPYIWFSLHWLAMSHSCYNPLIYCLMNQTLRNGFIELFSKISCCHRKVLRSRSMLLRERMTREGAGTSKRSSKSTLTTSIRSNSSRKNSLMVQRSGNIPLQHVARQRWSTGCRQMNTIYNINTL